MARTFSNKTFSNKTFSNKTFTNKNLLDLSPYTRLFLEQLNPLPSINMIIVYDTVIRSLVSTGIYFELDRFYWLASEIQQNATISLVNPGSRQIIEVNSPTWTQYQGYNGDGVTQYLKTFYNPLRSGTKYALNSMNIGAYVRQKNDVGFGINRIQLGGQTATSRAHFMHGVSSGLHFCNASSTNTFSMAPYGVGFVSMLRNNSANFDLYFNGNSITTLIKTSVAVPDTEFFILCSNNGGTPISLTTNQLSTAHAGSASINQLTLYNIIQAGMTQLGTQV